MQRRGWSKPQRTPTFIRTSAYSQYGFGDARAFLPIHSSPRPGAGGDGDASMYALSMPPTVTIPSVSMKLTEMENAYLGGAIVVPEPQMLSLVTKPNAPPPPSEEIAFVSRALIRSVVNSAFIRVVRNTL